MMFYGFVTFLMIFEWGFYCIFVFFNVFYCFV